MTVMLKRFKQWWQQVQHPIPATMEEFMQVVQIADFEFILRRAKETDIDDIVAMEEDVFDGVAPWSEAVFRAEIQKERGHLYMTLRHPETNSLVAYIGAIFRPGIHEVHITNLAVTPHWQRRQIGTFLLTYLMSLAQQSRYQRISLEVGVHNQVAQTLYQRLGFQIVRRRRNYYGQGLDAFDMAQLLNRHG